MHFKMKRQSVKGETNYYEKAVQRGHTVVGECCTMNDVTMTLCMGLLFKILMMMMGCRSLKTALPWSETLLRSMTIMCAYDSQVVSS